MSEKKKKQTKQKKKTSEWITRFTRPAGVTDGAPDLRLLDT